MKEIHKDGLTVGKLIKILKGMPQNKQFVVSSDEEQNTVYKGVYVVQYDDCVLIAGLSGRELDSEEDYQAP